MHLSIENVGIIDSAEIKLDGVTVIAGSNSSGKSTIGKIVYAIATSLAESSPLKLLTEKINSVNNEVKNLIKRYDVDFEINFKIDEIIDFIEEVSYQVNLFEKQPISNEEIKNANVNFINKLINLLDEINSILDSSDDSERDIENFLLNFDLGKIEEIARKDIYSDDLKYVVFQNVFNSEFNSQIRNITSNNEISHINFSEVNNNSIKLSFKENEISTDRSEIKINREFVRPLFIDNPSILDEFAENGRHLLMPTRMKFNHKWYLYQVLRNVNTEENIFTQEKNNRMIDQILNEVIRGDIRIDGRKSYYQLSDTKIDSKLSLANLSTGMKSFSILSILKNSGVLGNAEYVILDEPEIHLHPEWQLKYAELVVLLSKYFNVKFLVTSHSPYFIEAIELYSKRHLIGQKVNYYKSIQNNNNMNHYKLVDCTNDLDLIYDDLANSLFVLEELRNEEEE